MAKQAATKKPATIVGKLDQQNRRLNINAFELDNEIVFNYFNTVPEANRDEKFTQALYIGVLALMEDRMSAFFAKTSNELGTQLESLKMIFEMKKELFFKSAVKGQIAEQEIADALQEFLAKKSIKDSVALTGTASEKGKNKTGDILCQIDGTSYSISIECKFDKSMKLGNITDKDVLTKKSDTAWSQLIEADYNRGSQASIIVFDKALVDKSITSFTDSVAYIPQVGFIAIIDSQAGNYTNLGIAYMLARDIATNAKTVQLDPNVLTMMITRLVKDVKDILNVKNMVENNIQNNKEILKMLEKSLLMMEFNQKYLQKFLTDGTLSKEDLFNFYMGEDMKTTYDTICKDIENTYQ